MALPTTTYDTATLVNPSSALTDFTLMVDLSRNTPEWWAANNTTDATKGRAAKDDGTELACDWIDFDNVAQTGWLRVKWSGTLAASGTQTLRIYPPVAANASVAAGDTYGSNNAYDSNWVGYWPLYSDLADRTSNGIDLVLDAAGGSFGSGQTGGAWYSGNTRYASVALPSALSFPIHIMAWQYEDGTVAGVKNSVVLNQAAGEVNAGSNQNKSIICTSDIPQFVNRRFSNATASWGVDVSDQWVFADAYEDAADSRGIAINAGTYVTNTTSVTSFTTPRVQVGGNSLTIERIAEVQLHSAARSAAWRSSEYAQTNDQATFWGTWTNVPLAATEPSSYLGLATSTNQYVIGIE